MAAPIKISAAPPRGVGQGFGKPLRHERMVEERVDEVVDAGDDEDHGE